LYEKRINNKVVLKKLRKENVYDKVTKYLKNSILDDSLNESIIYSKSFMVSSMKKGYQFYFSLEMDNEDVIIIGVSTNISVIPIKMIMSYNINYMYIDDCRANIEYLDILLMWIDSQIKRELKQNDLQEKSVFLFKISNEEQKNYLLKYNFNYVGMLKNEIKEKNVFNLKKEVKNIN